MVGGVLGLRRRRRWSSVAFSFVGEVDADLEARSARRNGINIRDGGIF
jgi:hypothetical protein